ncbi:MAG: hypothetical protein HZB26_05915, partial [Candidatus Hydrogenedentes bacterium]|nr:hypothetical protein [Candidatus Hydrogenedentota bacterium]
MVSVLLLMSVLGVDPTVITSQTCAVTVDGPRITEIRNLVTGEAFRPDGNSFSLYDAANKPIPLDNPVVTQSGRETTVQAASSLGDQLTVTLWADGPDICLRLEAKTAQPGLRAAGFGFSGSHEPCTFIAPILGGMELTPATP